MLNVQNSFIVFQRVSHLYLHIAHAYIHTLPHMHKLVLDTGATDTERTFVHNYILPISFEFRLQRYSQLYTKVCIAEIKFRKGLTSCATMPVLGS